MPGQDTGTIGVIVICEIAFTHRERGYWNWVVLTILNGRPYAFSTDKSFYLKEANQVNMICSLTLSP